MINYHFNPLDSPRRSLSNDHIKVEYLSQAGPRIVGLYLSGDARNILASTPDITWHTPFGDYYLIGGHRLWIAPENPDLTAVPDHQGLVYQEHPGDVTLSNPAPPIGIRRTIEVSLQKDRPFVNLIHILGNESDHTFNIAAWAITQLPLGGIAILPQSSSKVDVQGLQPNRNLVVWPYSNWNDERIAINNDHIIVKGLPILPPCKIGFANRVGWMGYLHEGIFFCKRFAPRLEESLPDMFCNVEIYCNDLFLELETLSPLISLQPGEIITHLETWEIYRTDDMQKWPPDLAEVIQAITL